MLWYRDTSYYTTYFVLVDSVTVLNVVSCRSSINDIYIVYQEIFSSCTALESIFLYYARHWRRTPSREQLTLDIVFTLAWRRGRLGAGRGQ